MFCTAAQIRGFQIAAAVRSAVLAGQRVRIPALNGDEFKSLVQFLALAAS